MAARTQQILGSGQSSAPFTYLVPASTSFDLLAVRATFDGAAAAGAFLPALQLISDAGVVMAQVTTRSAVAAGGSADATFAPFLDGAADCNCAADSGSTDYTPPGSIETDPNLWAFWILDEAAGSTAHDSGPNGLDLTGTPVSWGNAPGPPGTVTVETGVGAVFSRAAGFAGLAAGDITAEVWFYRTNSGFGSMIGQGNPIASNHGFALSASADPGSVAILEVGNNVSSNGITGTTVLTANTWWYVAATQTGGVWRLYVNGVQEPGTATITASAEPGFAVGHDGTATFPFRGRLSYAAVYDRALSASEILAHYNLGGTINAPLGWLWTADGAGGAAWRAP